MSIVSLAEAKNFLGVIHGADDGMLERMILAAEDEALNFIAHSSFENLTECDSSVVVSEGALPEDVWMAVMLLVQANYRAAPEQAAALRKAAEMKLMPYRCDMGV